MWLPLQKPCVYPYINRHVATLLQQLHTKQSYTQLCTTLHLLYVIVHIHVRSFTSTCASHHDSISLLVYACTLMWKRPHVLNFQVFNFSVSKTLNALQFWNSSVGDSKATREDWERWIETRLRQIRLQASKANLVMQFCSLLASNYLTT